MFSRNATGSLVMGLSAVHGAVINNERRTETPRFRRRSPGPRFRACIVDSNDAVLRAFMAPLLASLCS